MAVITHYVIIFLMSVYNKIYPHILNSSKRMNETSSSLLTPVTILLGSFSSCVGINVNHKLQQWFLVFSCEDTDTLFIERCYFSHKREWLRGIPSLQ